MIRTCLIAAVASLATAVQGQGAGPADSLGSPLAGLAMARDGIAKHEGSWDRSGGNADMRRVDPGQTITLLDYRGAGIVRRFWVTIAPRAEKTIHRQAILRMYWDDSPTPCVEAPIGDFFGVGFGEQKDFISLPLNQTSGGYNCYWPMPFHRSARWTLTNLSSRRIDAFYYNIDFTALKSLPREMRHFHAQWRRENPTTPGRNYTILEAAGPGHFVGAALFMQNRRGRGLGFLEGDEMIHFDGEEKPSFIGTGTEDYFSSGWYFDRGVYSAPYHGVPILDGAQGRVSAYRWHVEDAIPFRRSIRVTIEHGHANDHEADYSSIAFYYSGEPHQPHPALPQDPAALLPFVPAPPMRIQGAIEGEDLIQGARATAGTVSAQTLEAYEGRWSGDAQLWWQPAEPGARLTLSFPAPAAGDYEVTAYMTKAPDYGRVAIALLEGDVAAFDASREIDLYGPRVAPTGPIPLGRMRLRQGANTLAIKVTGKNDRSTGYLVGLDALVLKLVE